MTVSERGSARTLRPSPAQGVTVRPIGPSDADALQGYVRRLSPESRYNRFFAALQELPKAELDRFTHLDEQSGLALLAEVNIAGATVMIGEACCAVTLRPDRCEFEFAVSVADEWRRRGLGTSLVADIEREARSLGACCLVGDVLRSNAPMKALARKSGFCIAANLPPDTRLIRIEKDFAPSPGLPASEWLKTYALAAAA